MLTAQLPVPADFLLMRDACSYGYFLLAPSLWMPKTLALRVTLALDGADRRADLIRRPLAVSVLLTQPGTAKARRPRRGAALHAELDRDLTAPQLESVVRQLTRMLRLDETAAQIRAFHRLDPRWKKTGNGRLCRTPSFFQDVIKTVTSCNVAWPSTVAMNRKLCELLGEKSPGGHRAFPTAAALAQTRPQTLRARCSVGYRDQRIVELARLFTRQDLLGHHPESFEDPATPDDALRERLLELPGIGPYAAANVMQLLGRYAFLPLDSESVRHGKTILGFRGKERQIMKRVEKHFAPFGEQKFRSYWFELRQFYESKRGPAHTWDSQTNGSSFTAAQF